MNGATFSPCRRYRYTLTRSWLFGEGACMFLMLNPSTADANHNDPTVAGCIKRAMAWGYASLEVRNLFAYRSTKPAALYHLADPVGPDNDAAILEAARAAQLVVCAWGTHGSFRGRGDEVLRMLARADVMPSYLALNDDGSPKHPLYVAHSIGPTKYAANTLCN